MGRNQKRESEGKDERSSTTEVMTRVMHEHMSADGGCAEPPAPLSPDEIMAIVEEMQAEPVSGARERAAKYGRKYVAFMEQCPALFQKACKPGIDMNMLRFMVETARGADEDENSSIVGARLAEKFVNARVPLP